VRQQQSS